MSYIFDVCKGHLVKLRLASMRNLDSGWSTVFGEKPDQFDSFVRVEQGSFDY